MARHSNIVAKDIFGESKGKKQFYKKIWQWDDNLNTIMKAKKISYKNRQNSKADQNFKNINSKTKQKGDQ